MGLGAGMITDPLYYVCLGGICAFLGVWPACFVLARLNKERAAFWTAGGGILALLVGIAAAVLAGAIKWAAGA